MLCYAMHLKWNIILYRTQLEGLITLSSLKNFKYQLVKDSGVTPHLGAHGRNLKGPRDITI